MIRSTLIALALVACCSAHVQADFVFDNFSNLDNPNDALATAANPNSSEITVEAFSSGGTLSTVPANDIYTFSATTGQSFTILYDWAGLYQNLVGVQNADDNSGVLKELPIGTFIGSLSEWTMTIDRGAGGSDTLTANAENFPGFDLTNADKLEMTFTYTGNTFGAVLFGGADLIATPEPTSLMMLGSVAVIGLVRRRRR